jgi:hypothetical protein
MKFDEWYRQAELKLCKATHRTCAEEAWKAAKTEALKVIDKYQHTPAFRYMKETMEREL